MRVSGGLQEWTRGDRIGKGGFCEVFEVRSCAGEVAAAKFIPKEDGADREVLFADLSGIRNVVPVIDRAETATHWVLVMPRAEKSLLEYVKDRSGPFDVGEAVAILTDVAETLSDLDGRVVHRDVKPANVLLLNGHWCLSDFGIAKFAEASTSEWTRKHSMSLPYTAPERWRGEEVTIASDVYAFGVIAYELLAGVRPFLGEDHELRAQHLHVSPAHLDTVPPLLAGLVEECLFKAAQTRPRPANVLARLARAGERPAQLAFSKLQQAGLAEAIRLGEEARTQSKARSEEERREELFNAARSLYTRISNTVKDAVTHAAPSAAVRSDGASWDIRLNRATFSFGGIHRTPENPWGAWGPLPFEVIAHARLGVTMPPNRFEYEGRGHSLWYCDARDEGVYDWFEVAFMVSPLRPFRALVNPFPIDPGADAAQAIGNGITEWQLAWPFTLVVVGDLDEFLRRWADYFADAASGALAHPGRMPERLVDGSWRTA